MRPATFPRTIVQDYSQMHRIRGFLLLAMLVAIGGRSLDLGFAQSISEQSLGSAMRADSSLADSGFSTLQAACSAASAAGKILAIVTTRKTSGSFLCAVAVWFPSGSRGRIIPGPGQTVTLTQVAGAAGSLDISAGGRFASSVVTPQTVRSSWFTGGDYGARVAAAAALLSIGGGTVDGATDESGTLVISNGEDIFAGCGINGCAIVLADNAGNPIRCEGISKLRGTEACITPRSNTKLLGGSLTQFNVENNASFHRMIETANDSSNIEIAQVKIDGRKSSIVNCSKGREQNHGIITDGTVNIRIHDNEIHDVCGDDITLESGVGANAFSSGEVFSNRFYGQERGGVVIISGNGLDIHDNVCDSTSGGFDCYHAEPDDEKQWVANTHLHHNRANGQGGESIGGWSTAASPHFTAVSLDDEIITGGGQLQCVDIPYCSIANVHIFDSTVQPAVKLATFGGQINGGEVVWSSPLTTGADSAVQMNCRPNYVPTAGQGYNSIRGLTIINASRIGVQNAGCNDSVISNNIVTGVCSVSGAAYGISISGDGKNANTGRHVLVEGNRVAGSPKCPKMVDNILEPDDGNDGYNSYFDNDLSDAAHRYVLGKSGSSIVRDSYPISFSERPGPKTESGGYPGPGSVMFCLDCRNATDDSATTGAVVTGGGHGAYMIWETSAPTETDWRLR